MYEISGDPVGWHHSAVVSTMEHVAAPGPERVPVGQRAQGWPSAAAVIAGHGTHDANSDGIVVVVVVVDKKNPLTNTWPGAGQGKHARPPSVLLLES